MRLVGSVPISRRLPLSMAIYERQNVQHLWQHVEQNDPTLTNQRINHPTNYYYYYYLLPRVVKKGCCRRRQLTSVIKDRRHQGVTIFFSVRFSLIRVSAESDVGLCIPVVETYALGTANASMHAASRLTASDHYMYRRPTADHTRITVNPSVC